MLRTGQEFAHFRIIRKLGEGGMGEVYLAEDQKLSRKVALKVLPSEFSDSRDRMERFMREARTAAGISHPNVMGIYDMGSERDPETDETVNYIVMEYVQGKSLTEFLSGRTLSMADLLRLAERIASGLAAAHRLNTVHRDIKPDNIMVDEGGEPKILDFGLAKPIESVFSGESDAGTGTISQELTQEGKIVGTVNYMSPEQARGESVDTRSDVFSFGILLYRMFTAKFPFEGSDKVSTIAKILEAKQAPVRQHNEGLPAELERIIDKCLQKRPDDRYQDTRDLVVDLRSLRRQYESGLSETVSGVQDSILPRPVMKVFRLRWPAVAVSVIIVAAVIFAWIRFLGGDSGQSTGLQARENALAVLGFENKTGDVDLDWLSAGLPEILMTDLAQGGAANLISRSRVLDCLERDVTLGEIPNHQECVTAAKSLGASAVLSGSFFKLGDKFRIDARIEDIESGKIILGEKVVGDDVFSLVDSLTRKVAQALNMKEMLADRSNVTTYTSSSPEAYKQYILGMEQFGIGRYDESIEFFKKAIAIDSAFALPYMRVGMANAFRGRQQQGQPYFELAKKYEDRLPLKDRNLLAVYYDIWFRGKFDDAFVKLKTYVDNYPDDKEGRAFYAIFLNQIIMDTAASRAQLDTVLMIDPDFQLALEFVADLEERAENFEKAAEYYRKIKDNSPESPASYIALARVYNRVGRYDDAIEECKELLRLDPTNTSARRHMTRSYIGKRDFEKATETTEQISEGHNDDPYVMMDYYGYLANLANWQGRFVDALKYEIEALEQARISGDSTRISNHYLAIATTYEDIGKPDSAVYFSSESYRWASNFQKLNHPFLMVAIDPNYDSVARPMFTSAVREFKSRLPSEMWELVDNLTESYEGYATSDTARIIEGFKRLADSPTQRSTQNLFQTGRYSVAAGDFEQAKQYLEPIVSGPYVTTDGFYFLRSLYYLAVANEELGDVATARKQFAEILKYWANPQIELKEIKDTRERLARLTS